ncbi:MAG: prefoldin subunit alpha [Candidatus Micrarchaeota archaeon]|nr:prefoldin subunit alpha [Candidatus Micrarchaeota archaeon]MDE1848332.1 prefoldin subunit alpha [Candidatus Micrarchaeota archaeon]MDE1864921.1 prefoldin subunit alpha [Candidatus Micrarchaeota archaeon]
MPQEDLEQLKYLYDAYTRQYEAIVGEISNYLMISAAYERNLEALSKLDIVQNSNMLVSLEAGTFMQVDVKEVKGLITNVGAGYMVEKSTAEAKEFLSKNSAKIQESISALVMQRQKVEKEVLDLSFRINAAQQPPVS